MPGRTREDSGEFRNGCPIRIPPLSMVNSRIALSCAAPRIFSTVSPRFISPNIPRTATG